MKFNGKDITELLALNRRNFIKFMVGGAAGTALTPIPWKLMDDVAIFSQNFPWVSVPPVGEYTQEKSVCTLCQGGCGIEVRKVDDRAVKIEGRTDYPINPGGICPVGMGGLQLLYDETLRFTGPMKRTGPRGSGQYTRITWKEAINTLADRIMGLRKSNKLDMLAVVDGNPAGSTMAQMIDRFTKAVGSPNYLRPQRAEDTFRMASYLMTGNNGPAAYDLENSDFILSFGSGLLEGWGSPGRVLNAWSLWKEEPENRSTKIVQVESRASNTASKADQWIAAIPGTEGALALGLSHVIIKEELYDSKFVDNYSFGFTDWTSEDGKNHSGFKELVLKKYSPAKVAHITGVKESDIISLARDFARAKAPVALCGKGKGALNGSVFEFMAILSLNALVGSINRPGGLLIRDNLPLEDLPDIELDEIARKGLDTPRLDKAGTSDYPLSHSLLNNFSEAVLKTDSSPVDTLLLFSANPAFTQPDGGSFSEALKKIPFIVSFSPYRDESAIMADLVLPDHSYLEKMDDVVWPTGLQYPLYGLTQPVVDPLYDTQNSGDTILHLAKKLGESIGSAFPWRKYEDVLKIRAKGLFESGQGLTRYKSSSPVWKQMRKEKEVKSDYKDFDSMWKNMKRGGLWYQPSHAYDNWDALFKTDMGKFEFFSRQMERTANGTSLSDLGISAPRDEAFMPHFENKHHDDAGSHYPLKMVPYEMINLASDWLPNPPYLKKTLFDNQLRKEESFVEINPETAAEYGLKQGDRAYMVFSKGKVKVRVNLFEGAMPGNVYLPLGLGHEAYNDFSKGKGVNPNRIIKAGKDPLSRYPVWWETPVKLTKAYK